MNTEITQTSSPTEMDKLLGWGIILVMLSELILIIYFWGWEAALDTIGALLILSVGLGDAFNEKVFVFLVMLALVIILGFGISGRNSKSSSEEYHLPIKQEIIFEEMFSSTLAKEFIKPNYIFPKNNSVLTLDKVLYSSLYTRPSSMVFPKTESQLHIEDWVQTLFTEIPKHIFAGIFGIDIGKMCFDCVRKKGMDSSPIKYLLQPEQNNSQ